MNLIRSEWTKLRSVRGTWIAALSTVFAGVALSVLGASDYFGATASELPDRWDPTATSLKGFLFAQLVIGMLGALVITPEHDNGMIGTTLAFVPSRRRLLAAKTAVVTAVAFVTSLVTTLVSFAVVQLTLSGTGVDAAGLGDAGVVRALLFATLFLTFVALIGVAVGVLTRSTTSSLAVLVGALLLVPALGPGLPGAIGDWFDQYWPITAGQKAYEVIPVDGAISPWLGVGILAAAAVALVGASQAAFHRRDV